VHAIEASIESFLSSKLYNLLILHVASHHNIPNLAIY